MAGLACFVWLICCDEICLVLDSVSVWLVDDSASGRSVAEEMAFMAWLPPELMPPIISSKLKDNKVDLPMLNIFSLYFEPWHLYFKKHLEQILAAYVSIFWLTFSVNCNPLARLSEMPEVKPLADQPVKACNGTYVAPHTRSAPSSRNSSSSGSGSPPEYQGREDFLRVFHEKIYYVTSGGLAYPDTSISALNLSAFYPVRKPTTMANTKREPWCINLAGTNHSVIIGIGGMSVVYWWETGVLVVDVVELDEKSKGKVVRAFYGKA